MPKMIVFQFSLAGWFDPKRADYPYEDDLVKWVKAPSREALDAFIRRKHLLIDEGGIQDDLPKRYELKDGVDCILDEDGKIVEGDIGQTVAEDGSKSRSLEQE